MNFTQNMFCFFTVDKLGYILFRYLSKNNLDENLDKFFAFSSRCADFQTRDELSAQLQIKKKWGESKLIVYSKFKYSFFPFQSSIRIRFMNVCLKMCLKHGRKTIIPSRKPSTPWSWKWPENATLVLLTPRKQPRLLCLQKLGTLFVLATCKMRIHCTNNCTHFLSENH